MVGMKSLDLIRKKVTEKSTPSGFDGESPFLTLKDGDAYVVRFLQEIDGAVADERRGQILVVEEHTSPKDYKIRAVCTAEDTGRCWACEQTTLPEIGKKWKPRMRFYGNVLVLTEKDGKTKLAEPKVKVLAQGFGDSNIGGDLLAVTEEYGNLTGQEFKLSRKGAGMNDTSYSLLPKPPKAMTKEEEASEVKDVTKWIKIVAYENQADYYNGNAVAEDSTSDW